MCARNANAERHPGERVESVSQEAHAKQGCARYTCGPSVVSRKYATYLEGRRKRGAVLKHKVPPLRFPSFGRESSGRDDRFFVLRINGTPH